MRIVTCEGESVSLSCTSGTKLHIQYADYGRFVSGELLCPNSAINDLNCDNADSSSIAINICEGMESCTLFASNSVFGDPFPGTYKYLELQYFCW